ncbi:RimK family alpha-L-glutamate ligase [Streptomyces sp. NBC_01803]|uniref:RimK family alpha-L-glutamate ligase n=1 Tax=Streptomyces sp. NBC_01803 TaxID=2975946 RepID=UPI002DD8A5E4|nr:RimK family alpha-L-glutamate ligase [Streptomyces sp. NBC_01803]WSA43128.1 RimK family alpha-L-glutamate ligase [Streptomyces sp. NBC_01803]
MTEPRVLLSVTMLRPEEKALLAAFRARGLRAEPALRPDLAAVLSDRQDPPDLALVRNLSHAEAASVARRLEHAGIPAVNSAAAIEICNDKGLQALLFARHGVPHPASRHAFSVEQVRELATEAGGPVVVKPVSGSWGRGVTLLPDRDGVEAWIGGRESVDAAGRSFPVLVQEYVDKPGHDLRVVVVGRTPVVAIERASDDWRTNTHLGARVRRVEVTPAVERLCARAVDVLGDGFYGVDLIEDARTGELKVLEVNANPEFARSAARHGVPVAELLADYLADRAHRGPAPLAA